MNSPDLNEQFVLAYGPNPKDFGLDLVELFKGLYPAREYLWDILSLKQCQRKFIDIDTLELLFPMQLAYPNFRKEDLGNVVILHLGEHHKFFAIKDGEGGNRYSLEEFSVWREKKTQVYLALGWIKLDKLTLEIHDLKASRYTDLPILQEDGTVYAYRSHMGYAPSFHKLEVLVERENEILLQTIQAQNNSDGKLSITCTISKYSLISTSAGQRLFCDTKQVDPPAWMEAISDVEGLRKNPFNRHLWSYLVDQPAYNGNYYFIASNRDNYIRFGECWVLVQPNFQNQPGLPKEILDEYYAYTNLTQGGAK